MAGSRRKDCECPFDMLLQELVTLILRKACERPAESYLSLGKKLPKIGLNKPWLSASVLHQLKMVCRRFLNLDDLEAPQHVVWELNSVAPLAAAAVMSQLGGHLEGLTLSYVHDWREEVPGGASIEFLTAVLRQAPRLSNFFLNSSHTKQTDEACHHLLGLLARVPLWTLWLMSSGFHFTEPLVARQQFSGLLEVRLAHSKLSDQFLHSLLEQSPKLRKLCLENCRGLIEPRFKAPSLRKLVMQDMVIYNREVMIDAPTLTALKGVPELRRLDLHAPILESLLLEGPIEVLETPACKIRLSVLGLRGHNWRIDVVMELLERFGASKRFDSQVETWSAAGEGESLFNLMNNIPKTVEWLSLGNASMQLYNLSLSKGEQQLLQFDKLIFVQFTVSVAEDFKLLSLCPNLGKTLVNLNNLEKPVHGLVTRAVDVQYEEPPQFVSSEHLLTVALHGQTEGLVGELRAFLYR